MPVSRWRAATAPHEQPVPIDQPRENPWIGKLPASHCGGLELNTVARFDNPALGMLLCGKQALRGERPATSHMR
jgi:hypothetical protein